MLSSGRTGASSSLRRSDAPEPALRRALQYAQRRVCSGQELLAYLARRGVAATAARRRSIFKPRKYGLNWFIPAEVNRTVGSPLGTSESLGTIVWPRAAKKDRNRWRSSRLCIDEETKGRFAEHALDEFGVKPAGRQLPR